MFLVQLEGVLPVIKIQSLYVHHPCPKGKLWKDFHQVLKVTNNSATFPAMISRRQPVPGHFNDDGILDLFIKHSANGVMQVK